MGFRFRRRLRIFPGLWLNMNKRGGSLSAGSRGLTVNFSPKGHQETLGLPGSGLSYRTRRRPIGKLGRPAGASRQPITRASVVSAIILVLLILWALQHAH
jgi:hypothetical protein